jgi:hypothetical protein
MYGQVRHPVTEIRNEINITGSIRRFLPRHHKLPSHLLRSLNIIATAKEPKRSVIHPACNLIEIDKQSRIIRTARMI